MLKTVELFAGIGGFRMASDCLGLTTVFANDMKPEACRVYRRNFDEKCFFEGDINDFLDRIPDHDLLTGGFPCQPFSAAGKKQGIRDPRGTLFETIVRVLKLKTPSLFVLENVKRLLTMEQGAHFATILSALSGLGYVVEWRLLNAKDFGLAQNRERIVISGRLCSSYTMRGIHSFSLADSFETAEHWGLFSAHGLDNSCWRPINEHAARFPHWGVAFDGKFFGADLGSIRSGVKSVKLSDILECDPAPEYDFTDRTLDRLVTNEIRNKFVNGVEILSNQSGGARMGYTIFGTSGLSPTLTASTSRHYERYKVGGRYRRLTPIEYARLQGFPDNHCSGISSYVAYSLYGNAVPPPMVEWVMRRLLGGERDGINLSEERENSYV